MLSDWIASQPRDGIFLRGAGEVLSYGDLADATRLERPPGQAVVRPGTTVASVSDLMTAPAPDRQMVVLDPRLPAEESERRLQAAGEAVGRDALTILFTSGSTGPAKAVRLTERNWAAAVGSSAQHLDHRHDDVWLAAMPLHHVGGLSILYRTAFVGAAIWWMPRFEVAAAVAALRDGVTMASFVPTMLRRILDHDEGGYSGLRAVLVGGGPIPDGLVERAHQRGIPALPTYGMTETCAQVATLRPGSGPARVARPLPGVEVRIGDGGRIELRAEQISPGYADEDDRPADDWFVTSDFGQLGPDGALTVLGRADDMIVTGGENVSPARVEAVLAGHPGVDAVVVVGLPDPEWGQRVAAMYEGPVKVEELVSWARSRLATAELPRLVRSIDLLPTGPAGQPDRQAAAEMMQ